MFSRWRPESVLCPNSVENLQGFLTALLKNARSGRYLTVLPTSDSSLLPISEHRRQLAPYLKLVLPTHESLLKAFDKSKTLTSAEKLGIPIPKTFYPKSMTDVVKISADIKYPAVVKTRQSVAWDSLGKATTSRPFYVNSVSELISTYAEVEKSFPLPMIQEYVPGYNVQLGLLFCHGEAKAACAIREHRTIPVTGGQSVFRESIPLDPELLRTASALLESFGWHGVAEVEFKVDSRDLVPKLMEINGRFWGSMNVAIESGVDFPYLLYLLAKEEKISPIFKYKAGVKFRCLIEDARNLYSTLKGEPKLKGMEPQNKVDAVLRFLRFYEKNIHYDGFALSDPLPFLMDQTVSVYVQAKSLIKRKVLLQYHCKSRKYPRNNRRGSPAKANRRSAKLNCKPNAKTNTQIEVKII